MVCKNSLLTKAWQDYCRNAARSVTATTVSAFPTQGYDSMCSHGVFSYPLHVGYPPASAESVQIGDIRSFLLTSVSSMSLMKNQNNFLEEFITVPPKDFNLWPIMFTHSSGTHRPFKNVKKIPDRFKSNRLSHSTSLRVQLVWRHVAWSLKRHSRPYFITFVCSLCALLTLTAGCADTSPQVRTQSAFALAARANWTPVELPGKHFTLTGLIPARDTAGVPLLTVYFEGDGLAWRTPEIASDDPTPLHPVALELALAQPAGAAAYVARPCQYRPDAHAQGCSERYWTDSRYASEVVDDMDHAVDLLKQRTGASQIALVGYSGGGALAALVAARRHDVALLVTVAANLDTAAWSRIERVRPLSGSLDPADFATALASVRQVHFVGAEDQVVPPAVAYAFAAHFPADAQPRVVEVSDFDHVCCWTQQWASLIAPLLPR
jgi:dienelactone hydrolase